ncbi:MAG: hypothetical protein OCD01_05290 [Fibrobacterales bacterium]
MNKLFFLALILTVIGCNDQQPVNPMSKTLFHNLGWGSSIPTGLNMKCEERDNISNCSILGETINEFGIHFSNIYYSFENDSRLIVIQLSPTDTTTSFKDLLGEIAESLGKPSSTNDSKSFWKHNKYKGVTLMQFPGSSPIIILGNP